MDRYCAQVADLLIEQIGTLSEKPTEESLAELNRNLRRARERYDALTDAQKQYVTRLEELKAAEEYYRTAEVEKADGTLAAAEAGGYQTDGTRRFGSRQADRACRNG